MENSAPTPRIAFVLKGYPRLSETFIAQEIRALEKAGLGILIVSLRHPTDLKRHALHDEIEAQCMYLPEYLHREPARVAAALWWAVRRPGIGRTLRIWLRDLFRDRSRNRVRRFGQALVLAAELPGDVDLLHAHFLHTPASVTRYAAMLLGRSWSCSAHARDIWTSPDWEKHEKLSSCGWCVTCTAANVDHLRGLAPHPEAVSLLYHGLDLERFPHYQRESAVRDGSGTSAPVRLLSVGRAVEKKGYDVLLHALAKLPPDLQWQFDHVGGGSEIAALQQLSEKLGLGGRVSWHGPCAQAEVLARYRRADLFALASKTAADGDKDGLPNVIVEAQSQGLACVATELSGIPELIEDQVNGLLVPPDDATALAKAMEHLMRDPQWRDVMGARGEAIVRSRFSLLPGIECLKEAFIRDRVALAGTSGQSTGRAANAAASAQ